MSRLADGQEALAAQIVCNHLVDKDVAPGNFETRQPHQEHLDRKLARAPRCSHLASHIHRGNCLRKPPLLLLQISIISRNHDQQRHPVPFWDRSISPCARPDATRKTHPQRSTFGEAND
jgi:hypothetical protein